MKKNQSLHPLSGSDEPPISKPRATAIQRLARQHAASAVQALVAVMTDDSASHAARVSAAGALLQWGFGKPTASRANLLSEGKKKAEHIIRLTWDEEEASK